MISQGAKKKREEKGETERRMQRGRRKDSNGLRGMVVIIMYSLHRHPDRLEGERRRTRGA